MSRLYCPTCKVRLLVGTREIAMCKNCRRLFDLRRRPMEPERRLHPLVLVATLALFFALLVAVVGGS